MSTFSMVLVKEIFDRNNADEIKEELGFIVTVLRDNDELVSFRAGAEYEGKITSLTRNGFWITENYETEEFISFADFEYFKKIGGYEICQK